MNKIIFTLIIILILVPYYFLEGNDDKLKLYFIDVGQGDGIIIKSPEDKIIIIDGGPYDNFYQKVSEKLPFRKRNIDLLIITHAHRDHYLGLINIIENYKIDNIFYSGYDIDLYDYKYLMDLIKEKNINLLAVKYGEEINFEKDIKLTILHPFIIKEKEEDINNTSVAIKLTYKNFDVIFTGDMTCEGEKELIQKEKILESEILKIGHHGSRWATCDYFLGKVKPKIGIIQVGKDNNFNHPHKETIDRLKNAQVEIFRNDLLGDIFISSNGYNYCINKSCYQTKP